MCDFENQDFCNWMNLEGLDDFDWRLMTGETPTPDTGPSYDHTMSVLMESGGELLFD